MHAHLPSSRISHHRLANAKIHLRQESLLEEDSAAATWTVELASATSSPLSLILAPSSSSTLTDDTLAAFSTTAAAASFSPTVMPAVSPNATTSSSALASPSTSSNHTESHATHVNAGTLMAIRSLMAAFGLFFLAYALCQLPWTMVRLSRGGWKVGWAVRTHRSYDARYGRPLRISRPTLAAVDDDEHEKPVDLGSKKAAGPRPLESSTDLVPVCLSERHYNEGWSGPSFRASTLIQRLPRTSLFPHYSPHVPFLNFTLSGFVLFLPFALVTVAASVANANYLWDATRTGFVPLAMLPFIFALGWKAGGLGTILQVGYASLATLHRWLARLCFLITTLHIISYMIVFDKEGTMKVQMRDLVNIEAWIGYGGMFVMTLFGCGAIRRRWYRLFKTCHHGGLVLFLGGMNYHSPTVFPFLMIAIVCTAANFAYRFLTSHLHVAELTPVQGAKTVVVTVPSVRSGWYAGQHVRIRILSGGMGLLGLESHPFTCASATDSSDGLRLVIKCNGDWTSKLFRIAEGGAVHEQEMMPRRVVMEIGGPYGRANLIPSTFSSVLIVVGGSGISYGLAIVEGVIQDCLKGDGRTSNVELVWTVRESELLAHTLPYFREILATALAIPRFNITIRLHCTSKSFPPAAVAAHSLKHLREAGVAPVVVYGDRPDLKAILDSLAARTCIGSGLVVCTCGPQVLVDNVAKLVDGMDKVLKDSIGVECCVELFSL